MNTSFRSRRWNGQKTEYLHFCNCDSCFSSLRACQQPTKIPRIGYLTGVSPSTNSARHETFRQGLRELGYVEGKNIVIEWRSAEGKFDRLPALAAELVHLKVDIIVTGGRSATRAAKEATVTIPIVMTQVGDPVGSGFVASLARPGGNITGLSTLAPELSGKRLELLKEIIPKLSRVGVFGTLTNPDNAHMESFFKTLKYEEVHLANYETYDDVIRGLPHFIVGKTAISSRLQI